MSRLTTLKSTLKPIASRLQTQVIGTGHRVDRPRQSSTQRGYGYRWQITRAGYLAKHPLCANCEAVGRFTVATDLDHIEPHKGNTDMFWDSSNWQGLCKSCHSAKTAGEDGGYGNQRAGG